MGRREKVVVLFDDTSRKDFVTGFRKRSLARKSAAQARAKEMETAAKIQIRREVGIDMLDCCRTERADGGYTSSVPLGCEE